MSTPNLLNGRKTYPCEGHCVGCSCPVSVEIEHDGGIALADHTGYSGFNDDGDYVCRDCFCPTCGDHHTDAEAHDRCNFEGRFTIDLTPPMTRGHALDVLSRYERAMRHERTVLH